MTDPKETFAQKSAVVKSQLQSLSSNATTTQQTFGQSSAQNILNTWQAEGVVTDANKAELQSAIASLPPNPEQINFQAMVDMISAQQEVMDQDTGLKLTEVAVMPSSNTAEGNPGQFYVEGVVAFWLCVGANRWVRLIQG